jgi:hypothetical protein
MWNATFPSTEDGAPVATERRRARGAISLGAAVDTGRRGGSLARVNRDRFVRTASVLVGLLVAALIAMMLLLPDSLSRVAEIFLR